jgi:hypothetical protein
MTTVGMRTFLTLDELATVLAATRYARIHGNPEDWRTLDLIVDRISVMLEHASSMHYPADLTIEVRP